MALRHQFELGPREVICLVGGGGKTTLLEALSLEFEAAGLRAVATTTTKIMAPGSQGRPLVLGQSLEEVRVGLGRIWEAEQSSGAESNAGRACRVPVAGTRVLGSGKLDGLPPEWICELRRLPGVEAIFVEADGAARLPLKAPAEYEPVIPPCATLVIAVAGLDAQRATIDDAHVHRAQIVAKLLDKHVGDRLVPEDILRVLLLGYQDRIPPCARFVVLLNKADANPLDPGLEEMARDAPVDVWVGSLLTAEGSIYPQLECIRRMPRRPAAVVLAAGLSTRFGGEDKVCQQVEGSTLVARAVRAALLGGAQPPIIVVVGRNRDRVENCLLREVPPETLGVTGAWRLVTNPHPEEGLGSSLAVGASRVQGRDILVLLADQPFVTSATVRRLTQVWERQVGVAAVALGWENGQWGPPVLMSRSLLPDLVSLRGDIGARDLLLGFEDKVVVVPSRGMEAKDIDTPADLKTLARR